LIRYHGTPITPEAAAAEILHGRHGMVSYHRPEQIGLVAERCQSFVLDNGAFSVWRSGATLDIAGYREFVECWRWHPGFDWCLIPDVIEGDEQANRELIDEWGDYANGVPVWHLHESLDWLAELAERFPRIALGSSGEYDTPGTEAWRRRMDEAFGVLCDDLGRPRVKVHGLRMMDPTIFSRYPFASVDSCNVARNIGIDSRWEKGPYTRHVSKSTRGLIVASNAEAHACAATFEPAEEYQNGYLFG
jgi:hypothetical protein